MDQKRSARGGMTLVEVIVTLVVLGILAAILIPSMIGWIDDANEKTCIANRGSMLEHFLGYCVILELDTEQATNSDFQAFVEDGNLGGQVKCPSGGIYTYANGEIWCSKHGNH
ncbi:MAG: type II secretion system protein [Clostridia bacterium]